MELPSIITTEGLLKEIEKKALYQNLIAQLNKDFELAGIDVFFKKDDKALELWLYLQEIVIMLLQTKFDDFLNFLYRVDIEEAKIVAIINAQKETMEQEICFLILKRMWQKVWYKKYY